MDRPRYDRAERPRYDRAERPQYDRADRDLRELLLYLRDSFQDAAGRIDDFLARIDDDQGQGQGFRREGRGQPTRHDGREAFTQRRPWESQQSTSAGDPYVHAGLEKLREEVRWISGEAPNMDPRRLRLYIEAVTAETRVLQTRAEDPEDSDIAAKIMRALTAIVSDHRPGHVYGLARHHQADWSDIARRAREELKELPDDDLPAHTSATASVEDEEL